MSNILDKFINMSERKAILVSEPWFSQIKDGSKKVEVRGNYGFFTRIQKGDKLLLTNKKDAEPDSDTLECVVKSAQTFKTDEGVEETLKLLFAEVKWDTIYPALNSEEEVKDMIKKLIKPEDIAKGLIALTIEPSKSGGRVRSKSKTKKKSKSRSRSRSKNKSKKR